MFRPLSLWQQIPCPAIEARGSCNVTHCLFSHDLPPPQPAPLIPVSPTPPAPQQTSSAPQTQSADPRIQSSIEVNAKDPSASNDTPLPPPPTVLSGDPRLRKIIEANSGSSDDSEDRRESKRRRVLDESTTPPDCGTVDSGTCRPVDGSAPTVKRTKTKVETGGSVAVAPKSILKKSSPTAQALSASTAPKATTANGSKVVTPGKSTTVSLTVSSSIGKSTAVKGPPQNLPSKYNLPAKPGTEAIKPLTLNPRLVFSSPATHAVRLQLLTLLHKEYVRLYEGKGDPQAMIRLALDEEEKVAKEMKSIYTPAMKKRILKLKNSSVADYKKEQEEKKKQAVREEEEKKRTKMVHGKVVDNGLDNRKPALDTGMTPVEELNALRNLLQSPVDLEKYKYILEPPTAEEIETAAKGAESAGGWEACDRCNSRFQVFDGRRESDGQLASGGECIYHWGRAAWPSRSSASHRPKDNDKIFTCCRQRVGQSAGCVTCENHVYKISEAKRLASIWQFIKSPGSQAPQNSPKSNSKKPIERAICLDCEMCYTTQGMELIRLTATAFPSGEVVVDALVRPQGGILDLNSRYSGVFPKHLMEATPYKKGPYPPTPKSQGSFKNPTSMELSDFVEEEEILPILPSPEAARSLLLGYIDSETPILGHALENDLNVLRLCHPTIIDTAILFPHIKGLPLRNKLKWLVERYLERKIQVDGDTPKGHDSKIDARCAGELVRWKIRECEVIKKSYQVKPPIPKRKEGAQEQRMDLDEVGI